MLIKRSIYASLDLDEAERAAGALEIAAKTTPDEVPVEAYIGAAAALRVLIEQAEPGIKDREDFIPLLSEHLHAQKEGGTIADRQIKRA